VCLSQGSLLIPHCIQNGIVIGALRAPITIPIHEMAYVNEGYLEAFGTDGVTAATSVMTFLANSKFLFT